MKPSEHLRLLAEKICDYFDHDKEYKIHNVQKLMTEYFLDSGVSLNVGEEKPLEDKRNSYCPYCGDQHCDGGC
mgnify:CR=1 FL=1